MLKKNIVYPARWDLAGSRGVVNKINGVVSALSRLGYSSRAVIVEEKGLRGHFNVLLCLFSLRADLIILRATAYSMPLLVFGLLWQRFIKSARIVVDVPTPFVAVYDEVGGKSGGLLSKSLKKLIIQFSFPWTLWVAHRVVQYAHESRRFSYGLGKKTLLMANGIDCEKIPVLQRAEVFDGMMLNFICVANVEFWHGFDRLLRGVRNYLSSPYKGVDVFVRIVGDGGDVERLRSLAKELELEGCVSFEGELRGESLSDIYETANLGVSSLALHRKGLTMASDLKTRDYVARGLPVIYCSDDLDVDADAGFFFRATPGEDPLDVHAVVKWYINGAGCGAFTFDALRTYALERMDFKAKVKKLIEG